MISKYDGKCKSCGNPYNEGDDIHWTKETGGRCWPCATSPQPTDVDPAALGFLPHEDAARKDWTQ